MKWRFTFNIKKNKTMLVGENIVEESGRLMRREWKM